VLYAASECEEMLGYLPRELAKVLAPLMDRQYVECEVKFSYYFARML
jgi:fanconi-associated nuclease 1